MLAQGTTQPGVNLQDGETILWSGQPNRKYWRLGLIMPRIASLVMLLPILGLGSLLFTIFSEHSITSQSLYSVVVLLFVMILVVGLIIAMNVMPGRIRRKLDQTHYFVTNLRAITIVNSSKEYSIESCRLDQNRKITIASGRKGTSTIAFDDLPKDCAEQLKFCAPVGTTLLNSTLVFWDVENADEVCRLIESRVAENSQTPPQPYTSIDPAARVLPPREPGFREAYHKLKMTVLAVCLGIVSIGAAALAISFTAMESSRQKANDELAAITKSAASAKPTKTSRHRKSKKASHHFAATK